LRDRATLRVRPHGAVAEPLSIRAPARSAVRLPPKPTECRRRAPRDPAVWRRLRRPAPPASRASPAIKTIAIGKKRVPPSSQMSMRRKFTLSSVRAEIVEDVRLQVSFVRRHSAQGRKPCQFREACLALADQSPQRNQRRDNGSNVPVQWVVAITACVSGQTA